MPPLAKPAARPPLWEGPFGPGRNGGVTQGLLRSWLVCRHRACLKLVEGWRPSEERWSRVLGFGLFWHTCEEALAAGRDWEAPLRAHAEGEVASHRTDQEEIAHWYNVCKVQFPLYVDYWAAHPETALRTPLFQEQKFDVPYALPSGRTVRLRGRWDSVDVEGKGKTAGLVLSDHKTKGDVDEQRILRQVGYDLQLNLYLVALDETVRRKDDLYLDAVKDGRLPGPLPVRAARLNVVRRPLSGGKGSIVRREGTAGTKCPKCKGAGTPGCPKCGGRGRVGGRPAETPAEFYDRLRDVIAADPGYFFMRWRTEVTPADVARFRRETLDPALEQLCDWWEWVSAGDSPFLTGSVYGKGTYRGGGGLHFVTPFGVNESLDGYGSPYDELIRTGSTLGLSRTTTLFPELED